MYDTVERLVSQSLQLARMTRGGSDLTDDSCDSPSEENVSLDSPTGEACSIATLPSSASLYSDTEELKCVVDRLAVCMPADAVCADATECRDALRTAPRSITAAVYEKLRDQSEPVEDVVPYVPKPRVACAAPVWLRQAALLGYRGVSAEGCGNVLEEHTYPHQRAFTQRAQPVFCTQDWTMRPVAVLRPWHDVAVARVVRNASALWVQLVALDLDAQAVHGAWLPCGEGVDLSTACFYDRGFDETVRPRFQAERAVAPVHSYYTLSKRQAEQVIPKHARNKRVKGREVQVVVLSSSATALKDHIWSERPRSITALQDQGLYVVPHQLHPDALRVFEHKQKQLAQKLVTPSPTVPEVVQQVLRQHGVYQRLRAYYCLTKEEANTVVTGCKWAHDTCAQVQFGVVDGWALACPGRDHLASEGFFLLSCFDADADRLYRHAARKSTLSTLPLVMDVCIAEQESKQTRACIKSSILPRLEEMLGGEYCPRVSESLEEAERACSVLDAIAFDADDALPEEMAHWSNGEGHLDKAPQCFASDTHIPQEDLAECTTVMVLPYDGDMIIRVRNAPTRNGKVIARLSPGDAYVCLKGTFSSGCEKWSPVRLEGGRIGFARSTPSPSAHTHTENHLVDTHEPLPFEPEEAPVPSGYAIHASRPVKDPRVSHCAVASRGTPVFSDSTAQCPIGVMLEPHVPALLMDENVEHGTVQVRLTHRRGVEWDFDMGWVSKADVMVGALPYLDSYISEWMDVQQANGFVMPTHSCFRKEGLKQISAIKSTRNDGQQKDRSAREEELAKLQYVVSFAPSSVQAPKESGCAYQFTSSSMAPTFNVAGIRKLDTTHVVSYDAYLKSWFRDLRTKRMPSLDSETSETDSITETTEDDDVQALHNLAIKCGWLNDALKRVVELEGACDNTPVNAAVEEISRTCLHLKDFNDPIEVQTETKRHDSEWVKGSFCLHSPPQTLSREKVLWKSVRYLGANKLSVYSGPSLSCERLVEIRPGALLHLSDVRCFSAKGTEKYAFVTAVSHITAPDCLSSSPVSSQSGWILLKHDGQEAVVPANVLSAAESVTPIRDIDSMIAVAFDETAFGAY